MDVKSSEGETLGAVPINNVVHCPMKWKEFVASTRDTGRNRRELVQAIEQSYKGPLREKVRTGQRWLNPHLFEIDRIMKYIFTMLAPIEDLPETVKIRDEYF